MSLVFVLQSVGGDPRLVLRTDRNFFGIIRVKRDPIHNLVGLLHGTTVHGIQSRDPVRRQEPLAYFHRTGPIGQVFAAFSGDRAKRKIGVIGLGAGTLASYVGPGQEMTFYEIDPAVERIAEDSTCFTYLKDGKARGARLGVVLGDARLQLQRSSERYGLIVLDAFSSDVVPIHLITREAIGVYLDRLEKDGVLAAHISSQYIRLETALGALARDANLVCLFQKHDAPPQGDAGPEVVSSRWVVMARRLEDLGPLMQDGRWQRIGTDPTARVWTDDYANVLSAVVWGEESGGRSRAFSSGGLGR